MPILLACRDLGADCEHAVEGDSIDNIVEAMQRHAIDVHGHDQSRIMSDEMAMTMRSAVKQSSRPAGIRTSDLGL